MLRRALCPLLLFAALAPAQAPAARAAVDRYLAAHRPALLQQFRVLLALPNLAADTPNIERNAAAVAALYQAAGAHTQLLRLPGAPPLVLATLATPGARRTLTFYAHYDGQPVHPSQWKIPPFQPVLRDGRIWARSAGDDKAAVFGLATALRALRAAHLAPTVNLRFLLEGEEEAGSPHLPAYFQAYPVLRHTDAWLVCDGPVHASGRMQVFFGARGIAELEMTVFGPLHAMHDGHYGNWAPNPIVMLARLLASMRDESAHVLIPGFYHDVLPLDADDRAALAALPQDDATLAYALGLGRTEGAPATLAYQISLPALNVRGIQGGAVGAGAANAIPTQASASLDFRLVPNQTPASVRAEVEAFLQQQGYFLVSQPPDAATRRAHPKLLQVHWGPGYPAARVSLAAPFSRQVVAAIQSALGQPIVRLPIMGGSVPLYLFQGPAHTPVVGVPIANYDDNQHAANENLKLDNLWQGIAVYAALFAGLPAR